MAKEKIMNLAMQEYYDEKIKAHIAAADDAKLAQAKKYADDLADNYDAAGVAQSKMEELANGAVKANTDAIAKLNGGATEAGSVAKAVADAKKLIDADVDAVEGKADQNASDITALKGRMDAIDTATTGRMAVAEKDIDNLEAAVKNIQENAYDDTELRELIQGNAGDIEALEGRADAVEAKVTTLIGSDANKSVRTIANEELAAQLVPAAAKESLDSLEEIAAWIQEHPDDAAAMNAAIVALQNQVKGIAAGEGTVKKYVDDAITALKIGDYAKAADLTALAGRVTTLEGKVDVTKVSTAIATAKQEAIDSATATAAADAKSKADAAQSAAIAKANELNTAMNERVEALEAIDHSHSNKTVLDGITAAKVTAWDAAEGNAKTYTDGLNTAMTTKVNGIDGRLTTAEGKLTTAEGNITSHGSRLTALEGKVGDGFEAITAAEIDAMFA